MSDVLIAAFLTLGLATALFGCWFYARTLHVVTFTSAGSHGFTAGDRVIVDGEPWSVTVVSPDTWRGKQRSRRKNLDTLLDR